MRLSGTGIPHRVFLGPKRNHRLNPGSERKATLTAHQWVKEFPGKIEVCDTNGILLEMNGRAEADENGQQLIGTNILDCHPEPARTKLEEILKNGRLNVYTIEKRGQKQLIYQTPWYIDGKYAGLVELSLEIPETMPHFIRQG
jgi:hypothetical protein